MGNSGSQDPNYRLPKENDASKPLNVIILGGHEVEKSTVGNAILGRKAFNFWSFFFNGCVEKQGNVNGRFIKVVHTPGWTGFDHTTSEYNKKEIATSVSRCSKGHVACVLVVSIDSESPEKDRKAAEQHMDLIGGSVWQHTALVFITRKPDERNLRETDNIKKHKWFKDKRGNSWHTFSKDNVNDLIEKLVGAATWYNGTDSCFKANNSAFSQESQMDSRCPEEITKTENGRLQQKNIEPQQATTSIHRGTTPESHHELSSASENTSGQLRKVYNIHTPESQQGQSVVNGNMATLEKVYNKSMATVTSQKKDLARFCRYLTSDEPGSRFVQELKQEDHELYQRLAVTLVNEHREELVQKVTTVRSIADALYSKKMVDNELNSQIQAETTSPGKMRKLYKALNSAEPVKAAFFELLAQKQFPLVQDLAKKKLRQLEACDVDVP